jgi:hypothetical protein
MPLPNGAGASKRWYSAVIWTVCRNPVAIGQIPVFVHVSTDRGGHL